jgi:hypothetical protein
MLDTFKCGFLFGILAAGFLGLVLVQIREARMRMGRQYQSLDTFPDAFQPHLTPAGIVRSSIAAMFTCLFWVAVLLVASYIFVRVLNSMEVL